MLRLVRTCGACPEQYDVFLGEEYIGYMRLRHGWFRAEYKGTIVYQARPDGDGCFECGERDGYLNEACLAIMGAHVWGMNRSKLYSIEEPNDGR